MKKNSLLLIVLLSIFQLKAQDVVFHFNPGFLMTQVDGDGYGGFKKMGYNLGAGFRFNNVEKSTFWDWGTRVNQKGYREVNEYIYDRATLNYLEMDLLYGKTFKSKIELAGGVYYGYLLQDIWQLRRRDVAPVFRFGYQLNETITLQSRFSWSVTSIKEKQYSIWLNRALLFDININL
jgi:hypothetical protein